MGDAAVEAQFADIVGNIAKCAVGGLAHHQSLLAECGRTRSGRGDARDLAIEPPQPLHETPGALHAFLGPDHVALGWRVGEHEPARGVGAVSFDDVVGVDDVLFRLRHLLDRADFERFAGCRQPGAARFTHAFHGDIGRLDPVAALRLVGLVHDHALREQAGERFVDIEVPGLVHGAGEEARIQKMQNRVLDAADILIDRQPFVRSLGRRRRGFVPRIGEAGEVPGRIDEGIHRVGFAPRVAGALRTLDVLPGGMAVERISGSVEIDVVRQHDGQVTRRHRHNAALVAMDDRDRTAPIALARNAPVAQAIIDLTLRHGAVAGGRLLKPRGNFLLRFIDGLAVEKARIDHAAVAVIGRLGDDESRRVLTRRAHHRRVAEAIFVDEIEVALVVRRTAENRAGAVVHQDEIGHIDRHGPLRVERMYGANAGVEAHLLGGVDGLLRGADALALFNEGSELRIFRGRRGGERMIGCDRHELGAEQSIRPRGEDFQFSLAGRHGGSVEHEANQQAFRLADPVLLHQADLVRPAVESVERLQQLLGVVADLEKPLDQFALLDQSAASPAAAVNDLLVGEYGVVDRVPVHLRLLTLDQSCFQEIEKHFLLVAVVARVAGGDLARPVERQAHRLELLLHRCDVGVGPFLGMDLAVDRRVFGRHAEGVPAHRMQHGVTHGPLEARHHVAHRVIAHMPHMDAPRRVGEHLEDVVFRPGIVVFGGVNALLVPQLLPAGLGGAGGVALGFARIDGHLRLFLRSREVT